MAELTDPRPPAIPFPRSPRSDRVWVAVAAILVGLVCGLPHLIRPAMLSREGKPYLPLVAGSADAVTYDETTLYAPRIREVMEGRLFSADPHGSGRPGDIPFLGNAWLDSIILGGLGLVLGRSVPAVFVFCDVALPPLIFLLLFAISRRLGAELWVAICAAFAVLFIDRAGLLGGPKPLEFTRLTTPEFAWVLTAGAILALILTWEQPRPRRAITAGLLVGACFYSDPCCGSFVLTGAALLACGAFASADQRRSVAMLGVALALGIALNAPVLWQIASPEGFTGKQELLPRSWSADSIAPLFEYPLDALVLVALLFLYPRRRRGFSPVLFFALAPWILALTLGPFLSSAGSALWITRCFQPWAKLTLVLVVGAWVTWLLLRRAIGPDVASAQRTIQVAFIALSLLFLVLGTAQQVRFSTQTAAKATVHPGDVRALRELAIRAESGDVVMCLDPGFAALIPVYTSCDLFLPYSLVSPLPTTELVDRAALMAAAYGVPEGRQRELLSASPPQQAGLAQWLFGREYADTPPQEAVDALVAKAAAYGPGALPAIAKDTRIDLVIWGGFEREVGDPGLEKQFADRLFIEGVTFRVYRARRLPEEKLEPWPVNLPDFEVPADGQDDGARNP